MVNDRRPTSMAALLARHDVVLMEAAIVERLRRGDHGVRLDPLLVHAPLVYQPAGRRALEQLYGEYVSVAEQAGLPILLGTPTWRANPERLAARGLTTNVNADAEHAAGVGAAHDATTALTATADNAAGAGSAYSASALLAAFAGTAAGTGAAYDATTTSTGEAVSASAMLASAFGAAYDATIATTGDTGGARRGAPIRILPTPDPDADEAYLGVI